ncbi:cysteine-rich protein 1 isoform X2 [Salmo salar]|uniref:Cysteine-rich protein 1 isoform X2 n=1 Tax=Salmo salar TaxID=8030 RepID=A0ABM3EBK6_SALSA|nr:cysteine-rich protein 1-like isoform X2 [Salmo salar]
MVGYCPICGKPVYFGEKKRSLGRDYHPLCLKCQQCQRQLTPGQHAEVWREREGGKRRRERRGTPGQHAEHDEKPYCTNCYMKMFGTRAGNRRLMSNCHSSASSSSSSS